MKIFWSFTQVSTRIAHRALASSYYVAPLAMLCVWFSHAREKLNDPMRLVSAEEVGQELLSDRNMLVEILVDLYNISKDCFDGKVDFGSERADVLLPEDLNVAGPSSHVETTTMADASCLQGSGL